MKQKKKALASPSSSTHGDESEAECNSLESTSEEELLRRPRSG